MSDPTYPSSQDVSAGQPTSVVQYNQLRADALTLGAAAADAVPVGTFLGGYISGISLAYLATNRLRVAYYAAFPPTLMIRGTMCQAQANVDLPTGSFSGPAADWYVFANRAAGSSSFTLSVNTSMSAGADQRLIGTCRWDGTALDTTSIQAYTPDSPGCKVSVVVLHGFVQNTSQTTYASQYVCKHLLNYGLLRSGAKAAYLVANMWATSATGYVRFYNTTDSATIVELSTTATSAYNLVKSGDLLAALPSASAETRLEWKTSGSRMDCDWAALVFEY
jgi:hypothetical protein